MDGRKILYASRSAAGSQRTKELSEVGHEFIETVNGTILIVKVTEPRVARIRRDEGKDEGRVLSVPANLTGTMWVNAVKKAHTQANRRAILALEAPGFMDESEISDIPGAKVEDDSERVAKARPATPSKRARSRITEKGR